MSGEQTTPASVRAAWLALAHSIEPGDTRAGRWVREVGCVRAAEAIAAGRAVRDVPGWLPIEGLHERWRASGWAEAEERAEQAQARVVARGDADWPGQLADLGDDEPYALWVAGAGSLRLLALRSVAMVGARAATAYGERVAREWAAAFADEGWVVMSGGALGIDGAAHRGALDADGVTIAVLACGVDIAYPRSHEALFARVSDSGLLVSEVPLGETARRQRFLARNRLISAMSRATVVVQAAVRSGTSATARVACELGRPVLAVPGPVTSPDHAGCHRLIRDGEAQLAAHWTDVLEAVSPVGSVAAASPVDAVPARPRDGLGSRDARVLDALPSRGGAGMEQVMARTGLDRLHVAAALGSLEALAWAERTQAGWRAIA